MVSRVSRMRLRMGLLVAGVLGLVLIAGLLGATPVSSAPATVVAGTPASGTESPSAPYRVVRSTTSSGAAHVFVRTPGAPGGPSVLVLGDSTTVHMIDAFAAQLQARGVRATVDATSGRTTRQGRAVLAKYLPGDYDYVVALLGANGRRENALRDMRALKRLGVDTMATVQTPRKAAVNKAVRRVFGSERITWAGYARKHRIATTDGKHYTAPHYAARARYLATTIDHRAR